MILSFHSHEKYCTREFDGDKFASISLLLHTLTSIIYNEPTVLVAQWLGKISRIQHLYAQNQPDLNLFHLRLLYYQPVIHCMANVHLMVTSNDFWSVLIVDYS